MSAVRKNDSYNIRRTKTFFLTYTIKKNTLILVSKYVKYKGNEEKSRRRDTSQRVPAGEKGYGRLL